MKQPHLLIVSRVSPFHSSGGMQAVAWDIAREFAKGGVRTTFLTTEILGKGTSFEQEGVEVQPLLGTRPGRYSRAWWRASRDHFRDRFMDTASAVLSVSAGAYSLLPFKRYVPGTRFVMQAHGTAIGEILSKWRTRRPRALVKSAYNALWLLRDLRNYRSFDSVAAVGDAAFESLRHPPISWFLPEKRVRLIRNGIDTELFSPNPEARARVRSVFGWSRDERVVVTVCRLHRQKGVDHALRGFSAYAVRDLRGRYLIVGEGPERSSLEELSHGLGLASRVAFVGDVRRQDVADFLRAGDAFLFTTVHQEGLPLNVLEAAAVGLPAVVSRHVKGVPTEVVAVEPVDPRDHRSIAEALARLLEGGDNAKDYQATSRLPEEYTLKRCVARYRELLF